MAKISYYMGKKIEEMSKEELIFALENTVDTVEQQRKDYLRELSMLGKCRRIPNWFERLIGIT